MTLYTGFGLEGSRHKEQTEPPDRKEKTSLKRVIVHTSCNLTCSIEAWSWLGTRAKHVRVLINLQTTRTKVDDWHDDGLEPFLFFFSFLFSLLRLVSRTAFSLLPVSTPNVKSLDCVLHQAVNSS